MKEKINSKYGSLLVVVLIIVIILIISTTVFLSISKTDITENANKVAFLNNVNEYKSQLDQYINDKQNADLRGYVRTKLNADKDSITYDNNVDTNKTIKDIITAINQQDIDSFKILNGNLVYVGQDLKKKEWLNSLGSYTSQNINSNNEKDSNLIVVSISAPSVSNISNINQKTKFILTINSKYSLSEQNIDSYIELYNDKNQTINDAKILVDLSNSNNQTEKSYIITIDTNNLDEGTYYLKLKKGSIFDINSNTNESDIISKEGFYVQNSSTTAQISAPTITLDTETASRSVVVTINTDVFGSQIKYSDDNKSTWKSYSSSFVISQNQTIYAIVTKGNLSSNIVSKYISNIDQIGPTIYISNPSKTYAKYGDTVTFTVEYYDDNFKEATLSSDDVILNKTSTANADVNVNKINNNEYNVNLTNIQGSGTISISLKKNTASDMAGNYALESQSSQQIVIDNTQPQLPIISMDTLDYTNKNVVVNINYPSDTAIKQYSFDGQNWLEYTNKITITDNCIIYARALDKAQNMSGTSTLTISNIDRKNPNINCNINGGNYEEKVDVNVNITDDISGVDESSLKYKWDTQNANLPSEGWNNFSNNSTITLNDKYGDIYLWIKAKDRAGNLTVYTSNLYTIIKNAGIEVINPNNTVVNSSQQVIYKVKYDTSIYKTINLNSSYVEVKNSSNASENISVYSESSSVKVIAINNITGNGKISMTVKPGSAVDNSGNLALQINDFSDIIVDNISPEINVSNPDKTIVNSNSTVNYTVTYSDENFDSENLANMINVNKASNVGYNLNVSGSSNIKTVSFSNLTGDGNVSFSIGYGSAKDKAQNVSGYFGPSASFEIDNTAPTVSISNPDKSYVKAGDSVTYTVTYNDKNFDTSTLNAQGIILYKNSNANADISVVNTDNTNIKKVILSNITGSGSLAIAIKNGTGKDKAGNYNQTTDLSSLANVDTQAPIVNISEPDKIYVNSSKTVQYTVTYTDDSFKECTLNSQNIILNKEGTANASVNVYGSGNTRTVLLTNITGDGNLSISIPAGTGFDNSLNQSLQSGPSIKIVVDNTAPNIFVSPPNKDVAYTGDSFSYNITYNDQNFKSTSLNESNISFNRYGNNVNGNLSITTNGNMQTVNISNVSGSGTISISIPYGIASDLCSNVSGYFGPSQSVQIRNYAQAPIFSVVSSSQTQDIIKLTNPSYSGDIYYSYNGIDWLKYSQNLTITQNITLYAVVKDQYDVNGYISTFTINNLT